MQSVDLDGWFLHMHKYVKTNKFLLYIFLVRCPFAGQADIFPLCHEKVDIRAFLDFVWLFLVINFWKIDTLCTQ